MWPVEVTKPTGHGPHHIRHLSLNPSAPHGSLCPGQTFLEKAHVCLAILQSFKPRIGWGRGNACQPSQAAVIFHLAPSCFAGKTGFFGLRVFPLLRRRVRAFFAHVLSSTHGWVASYVSDNSDRFRFTTCSTSGKLHDILWGKDHCPVSQWGHWYSGYTSDF